MKDLSYFHFKNSVAAKMKKGFGNFCNDEGSTSTLNQGQYCADHRTRTLEEMIMKLELEEEKAKGRRSSYEKDNNILMCARDALNQYPRFSLDGKDAMYRSSFRNAWEGRRSVCCASSLQMRRSHARNLPTKLGGVPVVWCNPGVVAKLMGLEAMPMPLTPRTRSRYS